MDKNIEMADAMELLLEKSKHYTQKGNSSSGIDRTINWSISKALLEVYILLAENELKNMGGLK